MLSLCPSSPFRAFSVHCSLFKMVIVALRFVLLDLSGYLFRGIHDGQWTTSACQKYNSSAWNIFGPKHVCNIMFDATQHLYGDFVFEDTFSIVPMVQLEMFMGIIWFSGIGLILKGWMFAPVVCVIKIFVHNVYTVWTVRMKPNDIMLWQ